MFKTLIVDDNKVGCLMLQEMLKKIDSVEVVGMFNSAMEARNYIKNNSIDILFLDIEMPGMTGIELLGILPEKPLTVLVSAKKEYALEAFELNVVDFLVKPISLSRVMLAVEKSIELLRMKDVRLKHVEKDYFFIRDNKAIRKILLSDILWVEAKGDYVKIITINSSYIIHSTLKNIEDSLPSQFFIRIHRGYLISIDKLEYIEEGAAYIQGTPLPVSETYKNELLKKLRML
jgi:DNA-binding LytR/AlgR family response regulator